MHASLRDPSFLSDPRFLPWVIRNSFHRTEIQARTRFDWRSLRARTWAECSDVAQDGSSIRSWSQWVDLPGRRRAFFRDAWALACEVGRGATMLVRPSVIAVTALLLIVGYA